MRSMSRESNTSVDSNWCSGLESSMNENNGYIQSVLRGVYCTVKQSKTEPFSR
jgi:hypothetical protein